MKTEENPFDGSAGNYRVILIILTLSYLVAGVLLFLANFSDISVWLERETGPRKAFFVQVFLWGFIGATMAATSFVANDKELNETERLKDSPDQTILRYPNEFDLWLYGLRIIGGGFFGIVGAMIIIAGLSVVDIDLDSFNIKQKLLLSISAFLIGLHEKRFVDSLNILSKKLIQARRISKKNGGDGNTGSEAEE